MTEVIQFVANLISSVGFPIAVCLICFWYINKTETAHKDEMLKMSEALQNNTTVMQTLIEKIERLIAK